MDYDERKVFVTALADEMLKTDPELYKQFQALDRQHDIGKRILVLLTNVGDAIGHLRKFIEEKAAEVKAEQAQAEMRRNHSLVRRPLKKSKYFESPAEEA